MVQLTESEKTAYVFPGQGSQSVGMGLEQYQRSMEACRVFQEADKVLGFSLSKLCFEGPQEELTLTYNAQPAIFTVSIAGLRYLEEVSGQKQPYARFVAGHSLGEYTALVAAQAIDFPNALQLVRTRGILMDEANSLTPGGMAAIIGLDQSTVEEICQQTGLQMSNINSPDQIVISGLKDNLPIAMDLARARGAKKVVPLAVSSAFHSALMEPTIEGMARALDKVELAAPAIPVVANITGKPMTTVQEVKAELLKQLCECVHWLKSVEFMISAGVSNFMEVGPGRTLSGLVRRINSEVATLNLADMFKSQESGS